MELSWTKVTREGQEGTSCQYEALHPQGGKVTVFPVKGAWTLLYRNRVNQAFYRDYHYLADAQAAAVEVIDLLRAGKMARL